MYKLTGVMKQIVCDEHASPMLVGTARELVSVIDCAYKSPFHKRKNLTNNVSMLAPNNVFHSLVLLHVTAVLCT